MKQHCPGRRDLSRMPIFPQYSKVYDHAVRPKAMCLDCGAIVAVKKNGELYRHAAAAALAPDSPQ